MSYNLTSIGGNQTTILSVTQGVNDVLMHGMYGVMMLVGLWVVIFIAIVASTNDGIKAWMVSSFITFTLAVSLAAIGLIPQLAIFIPLIGIAVAVGISWGR